MGLTGDAAGAAIGRAAGTGDTACKAAGQPAGTGDGGSAAGAGTKGSPTGTARPAVAGPAACGTYDALRLDNQLCFPLYVVSKEITRRYAPLLRGLGLTYTQYITMMALWELRSATVRDLCRRLYLDSGTLTPILKKLEARGLVTRSRDGRDERRVVVEVTDEGMELRDRALEVPAGMARCVDLSSDEALELRRILDKLLAGVERSFGDEGAEGRAMDSHVMPHAG